MFRDHRSPRIFGTHSGQEFPAALLQGISERLGTSPPEDWARVEVYVNTRRMQRRLFHLFLQGPARLMPKIHLITDLAKSATLSSLPMPVPALQRRLEIAQLVRGLLSRVDGLAPRSAVFDLAKSLAALMDEMQGEGIAPEAIANLDVSDVSVIGSGHYSSLI